MRGEGFRNIKYVMMRAFDGRAGVIRIVFENQFWLESA
jgi:hypothetical protein